jgi:hypothetical protein
LIEIIIDKTKPLAIYNSLTLIYECFDPLDLAFFINSEYYEETKKRDSDLRQGKDKLACCVIQPIK